MLPCFTQSMDEATPIFMLSEDTYKNWQHTQSLFVQNWLKACGFLPKSGQVCQIPNADGHLQAVAVGADSETDFSVWGALPAQLPKGQYHVAGKSADLQQAKAAHFWGLGAYQFDRYKAFPVIGAKLYVVPDATFSVNIPLQAIYWVRDLINTPAADMQPQDLVKAAEQLVTKFDAKLTTLCGDALLARGYAAVYAVGRASRQAPVLIDLCWGNPGHPKVTLVGKGVCFDTGGLDLKTTAGMAEMKKDMGGAAHVLGLAQIIMSQNLPVSLRVLIPAVENAIGGNAYRPGDVLRTRAGKTVEITNTDAEGRLILCEALDEAAKAEPDLLLDFATLTGAARVALGTEIAACFTRHTQLATDICRAGVLQQDPVWQLPLHTPYRSLLKSDIADIKNAAASGYGGAITAALFLETFVPASVCWVHFDVMASNQRATPGRPKGGEAHALCAVAHYLQDRFGS